MNVIEAYDFVICSVCCGNSSSNYFNIFDNYIGYNSKFFSLLEIINDTLSIKITNEEMRICSSCKTKIVDFFIFKKRNEEARQIYKDSHYKSLILNTAAGDEMEIEKNNDDSSSSSMQLFQNSQFYLSFNETSFVDENQDMDEIFNDEGPDEEILPQLLFLKTPLESPEAIPQKPKRKLHPENWERTRRKVAKNMGKSYVATSGKIIEAKRMKPNCGDKCRIKCNTRINEETRQKNFDEFYNNLADLELQRKFILDHIQTFEPKHTKLSTKSRSIQRLFFLDGEKEGEMVQVCKSMFLNTLCVSSQILDTIQLRTSRYFNSMADFRGRYTRRKC